MDAMTTQFWWYSGPRGGSGGLLHRYIAGPSTCLACRRVQHLAGGFAIGPVEGAGILHSTGDWFPLAMLRWPGPDLDPSYPIRWKAKPPSPPSTPLAPPLKTSRNH